MCYSFIQMSYANRKMQAVLNYIPRHNLSLHLMQRYRKMNGVQMNKQTSYQQKTGFRFRSPFQFFGTPLIFDMGTVAKGLIRRFSTTADKRPLFNNHTPIGEHNSYMPTNTQWTAFDNLYDHLGFYRHNRSFIAVSFLVLYSLKQQIRFFCLLYR